jgi:hypothetical protein
MPRLCIAVLLFSCGVTAAQSAAPVPAQTRGFVYREVTFGCGQAWSADVSRTTVTLSIAGARARLHVDARIVEAAGGVDALVGGGGPYHHEHERTLVIDWRGRARREHGATVIALRSLTETAPVDGSTISVTTRSTEMAVLRCVPEEHDLLAASRPAVRDGEPAVGRATIVACTFEPREHEGPLPRPVRDVLTTPFFVDGGAGVTTDAHYEGHVTVPATELVVRAPGWVDPG